MKNLKNLKLESWDDLIPMLLGYTLGSAVLLGGIALKTAWMVVVGVWTLRYLGVM